MYISILAFRILILISVMSCKLGLHLNGFLFLTERYICFDSRLRGDQRVQIAIKDIVEMHKSKSIVNGLIFTLNDVRFSPQWVAII